MDESLLPQTLALAGELRAGGINTEAVVDGGKLARQFKYADRSGIRFVLVLGPEEIARDVVAVKDLRRQSQSDVPRAGVVAWLQAESTRDP
jgi:histidyl-tRNA synthetase